MNKSFPPCAYKICFISPSLSARWKQWYLTSLLHGWIRGINCAVHGLWFSLVSDKFIFWSRENHVGIDWSPMIWVKQHSKIVSPSACLSLSHGCICDCTSSPQDHDRLLQASLSLLTLSSLPARSPFPPNPQFPRNHCLWILHPILIHPHCWDTQDLPHLHHLTRKTLHQPLLLPDLPLIRLYGDSSTLGNPTLLTKYSQERNAGPVANLWTTQFFLV